MATVSEIMDRDAPTVGPDEPVESIVRQLAAADGGGLVVVNDGGRCVGIITEADLVLPGEDGDLHIPHYIELFGGLVFLEPLQRFHERLRKAAALTAGALMTRDPVVVEHDATPREAAHLIAEHHHNRLPVIEHGRFVGLITRADVLGALARE